MTAHPYRSSPVERVGPRWGATRWVKFVVRVKQLADPVTMHYRAERLKRRFEREEGRFRENAIAHCWERIQIDAGFLYPPHCVCGEHAKEIVFTSPDEPAASWSMGEPAKGKLVWRRRSA